MTLVLRSNTGFFFARNLMRNYFCEYMSVNQARVSYISVKLIKKLRCLGSDMSSTEDNVSICIEKA